MSCEQVWGGPIGRKRFIDLSVSIESDLPSDPPMMIPKIDYVDHNMGANQMLDFFPGIRRDQLPGGLGWAFGGPIGAILPGAAASHPLVESQ